MNDYWKKIKVKYPKALYELITWCIKKYGVGTYIESDLLRDGYYYIRDLYDFFDDNGIIIVVNYNGKFWYEISKNIGKIRVSKCYNERNEAEKKSYKKAFEILEEKIRTRNKI